MTIPLAARPSLALRQLDMGSLITCAQIWVHAVHTKGGQVFKLVCTRADSEGQKTDNTRTGNSGGTSERQGGVERNYVHKYLQTELN